jgi:hypothetical protein
VKARTVLKLSLFATIVFTLAGCASISVKQGTETEVTQPPEKIYVALFSTAKGEFNVDRDGAELTTFKKELAKALQAGQVADLNARLIASDAAPRHAGARPRRAWLVTGEFVRVNQGSRALRAVFGFGLGGTKMETKVRVYDLSQPDHGAFLTFETTGGSNAEPGAVTAFATDPLTLAVQIALGGASGFSHGITEDTKRTAREITAVLSDVMYRRHWIPKSEWIKPKDYTPDVPAPPGSGF